MTNYIERYWRDAKPEDAIKHPPMVARFQDNDYGFWVIGELIYWDRSEIPWYREEDVGYERCQVYDAPDPGEGWRLIDVENETKQEGDEYWHHMKKWVIADDGPFCRRDTYRRRIEQPKPEPRYEPFRWEDREQLRGRWIGSNDGRWERFVAVMYHESEFFWVNGNNAESLCADWRFLDTGEPVGRRIQ